MKTIRVVAAVICDFIQEKEDKSMYPIVGLEHLTPEQITLQNWDLNTENTFTKVFRKGNILFGRRRAYLKKAAVAPFDGICSGDITVIEAKEDKIIPELLPFVIQNDDLFDFAVGKSAGSLSPRVKWTHLQNYKFELPDKQKQHELAKVLWAIEDTRKSYQQLIKKTDELVKFFRSNRKWCKRRGSSLQCQNCFFVYPIIDCNLKKYVCNSLSG